MSENMEEENPNQGKTIEKIGLSGGGEPLEVQIVSQGNTLRKRMKMTNKYKHKYKYILNAIGSGDKYWRCEVCGGDVQTMYFQIELLYPIEEDNITTKHKHKWTSENCQNLLGHKECLMGMQR